MEELDNHIPIVWIEHEECTGIVRSLGAFTSLVEYLKDGLRIKVWMENEDFEIIKYVSFGEEEY